MQTIILNTTGIRDGLSEGLTNLLDYIKTGKVTDTYTADLQRQVEMLKYDEDWRDRYMTLEMKMDEKYDAGFDAGIENGNLSKIFSQITRKLQKNKTLEQIADELEEEVDEIAPLVEHVRKYAPAYDIEQMVSEYLKEVEKE